MEKSRDLDALEPQESFETNQEHVVPVTKSKLPRVFTY